MTEALRDAFPSSFREAPPRISKDGNVYQLGTELGRGGFAVVFQALNVTTGDFVAVKRCLISTLDGDTLASIESEIELMQQLQHPNIVKYIDTIRTDRYLYIVLEYMENGSLAAVIKRFGNLSESLAAIYITQVLRGLAYLHDQGVLHRDMKAANILTNKEGLVKLADFGVAMKASDIVVSTDEFRDVAGSPYWIAPEIIEMAVPTPACDIWSVGCIVVELITGAPPYFDLEPLAALFRIVRDDCPPLPQGVSPALTDFLRQCFQKEPSMRATAAMLLEHPWLQKSAIPPIAAEREVRLLNSRSVGCGSGWGTPTAPNNTSVGLLTEASMDSVANTVRLFVKQSASTPTTPHHQSIQPNLSSMSSISSGTPQAKFLEAPSLPPSGGVALPPADGIAMINRNALPVSPLGRAADGIAEWDDIFGATTTDNLRDSRISHGSMSRPTGIATLSSQTISTVGIDIPRIPNTKSTTGTEENDMRESLIRRGLMPLPVVPVPHTLNSASSSTRISSVSSNASNGSGGTSSGIYGSSSMTLGSRSRVLAMSFLPINDNIVEGSVQYRSDGIVPLVAYRENSDNDVWDSDFESLPSTQQNVESQHASSTPFVQRQHRQYTLPNIIDSLDSDDNGSTGGGATRRVFAALERSSSSQFSSTDRSDRRPHTSDDLQPTARHRTGIQTTQDVHSPFGSSSSGDMDDSFVYSSLSGTESFADILRNRLHAVTANSISTGPAADSLSASRGEDAFYLDAHDFVENIARDRAWRLERHLLDLLSSFTKVTDPLSVTAIGEAVLTIFASAPEQRSSLVAHHGVTILVELFTCNDDSPDAAPFIPAIGSPTGTLLSCEEVRIVYTLRIVNTVMTASVRTQEHLALVGLLPTVIALFNSYCPSLAAHLGKTMAELNTLPNFGGQVVSSLSEASPHYYNPPEQPSIFPLPPTVSRNPSSAPVATLQCEFSTSTVPSCDSPHPRPPSLQHTETHAFPSMAIPEDYSTGNTEYSTIVGMIASAITTLNEANDEVQLQGTSPNVSAYRYMPHSVKERNYDIAIEAARFIHKVANASPLGLQLLVGAGGLAVFTSMVSFARLLPAESPIETSSSSDLSTTKNKVNINQPPCHLTPLVVPPSSPDSSSLTNETHWSVALTTEIVIGGLDCIAAVFTQQAARSRDVCRVFVRLHLLPHLAVAFNRLFTRLRRELHQRLSYIRIICKEHNNSDDESAGKISNLMTAESLPSNGLAMVYCCLLARLFVRLSHSDAVVATAMGSPGGVLSALLSALRDPIFLGIAGPFPHSKDNIATLQSSSSSPGSPSKTFIEPVLFPVDMERRVVPLTFGQLELLEALLRAVRQLSMEPAAHTALDTAGGISTLVRLLNAHESASHTPIDSTASPSIASNVWLGFMCYDSTIRQPLLLWGEKCRAQILGSLFHLCRLHRKRLEAATATGLIPHLLKVAATSTALRQFALPLLCDCAHASAATRNALEISGGASDTFLSLLKDGYWAVYALQAIAAWLPHSSNLGVKLAMPCSIEKLTKFFLQASRTALTPLVDIVSRSNAVARELSEQPAVVKSLLQHLVEYSELTSSNEDSNSAESHELRCEHKSGSTDGLQTFTPIAGLTPHGGSHDRVFQIPSDSLSVQSLSGSIGLVLSDDSISPISSRLATSSTSNFGTQPCAPTLTRQTTQRGSGDEAMAVRQYLRLLHQLLIHNPNPVKFAHTWDITTTVSSLAAAKEHVVVSQLAARLIAEVRHQERRQERRLSVNDRIAAADAAAAAIAAVAESIKNGTPVDGESQVKFVRPTSISSRRASLAARQQTPP